MSTASELSESIGWRSPRWASGARRLRAAARALRPAAPARLLRGAREQIGEPAGAAAAGRLAAGRGLSAALRARRGGGGIGGGLTPVMSARGGPRRLGARRRHWRSAGSRGRGAVRGLDRLDPARAERLDRVEAAAVPGDDAVELGQRLDLVDDHAAHLGGAFGGLLRQFEDALAQLGAGGFELLLHLGRHLLEPVDHLGETLRRLRRASPGRRRWPARRSSCIASVVRLRSSSWTVRIASKFSAIARAPWWSNSATSRAISRARSAAPSSDWSSSVREARRGAARPEPCRQLPSR